MSNPAASSAPKPSGQTFRWDDPFDLTGRLTDEERMVQDAARSYAREALLPRIVAAFRDETFDRAIMTEMGEMGFLGAMLPEQYGG
ncbi:acyl-CoA dehydrogenase family protein, partial [Brevundimonas naejangsanensis]|uniref:acyl-CoA dehydrogenase family protein n=1 Tax=Brevundimonas naejangsanensis TaxID=588932 RepID=UPI00320AFAF1